MLGRGRDEKPISNRTIHLLLLGTRVGATLTDLGAQLTQDVLLGPDQRLLKPFFDILKNRGEGTSQS